MAQPKLKVVARQPVKLTMGQIQDRMISIQHIRDQIKDLEKEKKKLGAEICFTLGKHGRYQFDTSPEDSETPIILGCTVVSPMKRPAIPWRKLAVGLAKKFLDADGFRKWIRALVKKYPKEPSEPYALVQPIKK